MRQEVIMCRNCFDDPGPLGCLCCGAEPCEPDEHLESTDAAEDTEDERQAA
jgi:hypothetical protein